MPNRSHFIRNIVFLICLLTLNTFFSSKLNAQETPPVIYVILDGSGSMWQKLDDGTFKIAAAKKVLQDFVQRDFQGQELAFRVYGHRRKGDCRDSELIFPFQPADQAIAPMKAFSETVNPTGKTPISYSLREALKDFGDREGEIILISDGIETCDEDPCALIKEWREKDIKIKIHVVGLGLDEKSKEAMRCIADAAGTPYRDAGSATDLEESLSDIHKASSVALKIIATSPAGESLQVKGTLSQNGAKKYDVMSHARNVVDSGEYQLTVGVETANGNLYQPVTQAISVANAGETVVELTVPEPPSVKTVFLDEGKSIPGGIVTAFQNEQEVFRFRWKDRKYLDEGTYTFKAQPNKENDVAKTETFAAGNHKELVFELLHTVHAKFNLIAAGGDYLYREHQELWQNGELKYKVHYNNGARILPGNYELRLASKYNQFSTDVVVSGEAKQTLEIAVPSAAFTVIYQNADGSQAADKRYFFGAGMEKQCCTKQSGRKIIATPGTYNIRGWKGNYNPVILELEAGEDKEIILREK